MSSYFSLPSFARAKKNKEELEKSNPQNPVLKDEDEKFLEKQISSGQTAPEAEQEPAAKIGDSGDMEETSKEQQEADVAEDQVVVPETQPQAGSDAPPPTSNDETTEDHPEQAPSDTVQSTEATSVEAKKEKKKNKDFELPSQEDAEAATRGFDVGSNDKSDTNDSQPDAKRTWASYIPSIGSSASKDNAARDKQIEQAKQYGLSLGKPTDASTITDANSAQPESDTDQPQQRTWTQYAYSSLPTISSLTPAFLSNSKDKDSTATPVYNADGSIDEAQTALKQEREVSVLLDNLNMSAINNRVFALSDSTQDIYQRFAQVLKDTMNGAPTAYEDMETLMKEAGPQLEKQFKAMPPFVQTLVKALPAKLGTTLGPEILAAASEKPGADMKTRMQAASSEGGGKEEEVIGGEEKKKQKRRIPGLKGLVSEQGAVASILRNVVNYLQVRFPLLASGTNVVMSLAVFILMFVFWYCHKRGRETRLAGEAATGSDGADDEVSSEDEEAEAESGETDNAESNTGGKEDVLNQPQPAEVSLPDEAKGEKGAELEATKSVGV